MIEKFAYFPTIVYRDEHPEWIDYLKYHTLHYFEQQQNQGATCQTYNLVKDSNLKFFSDYLLSIGHDILTEQGYFLDHYELYISGLWGQLTRGYGGTDVHIHKHSQLCGWIFLEAPIGGSYPIFYDTRANKQVMELNTYPTKVVNNATSEVHFNNMVPGTIILSNSWMNHRLTPNMVDVPTKTLHFIISHREKLCNTC